MKKLKEELKGLWLRGRVRVFQAFIFFYILTVNKINAYAKTGGFSGSIYETGTKKMLKDLLSVGQVILAAAALVFWVFWEMQKRMGEENEEGKYTKKQKATIIGLIVAETIGTLFGIIGGYYGISIGG